AHITRASGIIDPTDPTAIALGAKPIGALTACTGAGAPTAANPGLSPNCDVFTGFVERGQDLSGNQLPQSTKNKVAVNLLYTFETEHGSLTPTISYIWRDKQYGSIFQRAYNQSPSWDQVDARLTWKDRDNKYSV